VGDLKKWGKQKQSKASLWIGEKVQSEALDRWIVGQRREEKMGSKKPPGEEWFFVYGGRSSVGSET